MANKPLKSIKYPGLPDTYTFLQNDPTLTQSGQAADAKVTGDKIEEVKSDIELIDDDVQSLRYIDGYYINTDYDVYLPAAAWHWILYPVKSGDEIYIKAPGYYSVWYSVFREYSEPVAEETPPYATGYSGGLIKLVALQDATFTIPTDGRYLVFAPNDSTVINRTITINGINVDALYTGKSLRRRVESLEENKLNSNLGIGHAGKLLSVGNGGDITPVNLPVDATLTHSGEPADAKATGDGLVSKLDKFQGVAQSGKTLKVGSDGYIKDENVTIPEIDSTLNLSGHAADAKATGDAVRSKLEKPSGNGTVGQVLASNGMGGTVWSNPIVPSSEDVSNAISVWLAAHPEATTTVLDGSITRSKIENSFLPYITAATLVSTLSELSAAFSAGKSVIILKKGVEFEIASQINVPENTYIIGYGANIKRADGFDGVLLRLAKNCKLEGMHIDGNRTNTILPKWDTTTEIRIGATGNCIIENVWIEHGNEAIICYGDNSIVRGCKITDCGGNAIHFSGGNNTRVEDCYIVGCNKKSGMGHEDGCIIWSDQCNYITCTGNWVEDGISGFGSLDWENNDNAKIIGNTIKDCRVCAIDITSFTKFPHNILISNNHIINSVKMIVANYQTDKVMSRSIVIEGNVFESTYLDARYVNGLIVSDNIFNGCYIIALYCENVIIKSNKVDYNGASGLQCDYSHHAVVSDNIINCKQYGIRINNVHGAVVNGNTIKQKYHTDNPNEPAIKVGVNGFGSSITNNKLFIYYGFGIYVFDNVTVVGNNIDAAENTLRALQLNSGRAGTVLIGNTSNGAINISPGSNCYAAGNIATSATEFMGVVFTITNITTNRSGKCLYGDEYAFILSANEGYVLPSTISITMGGTALTEETEYSYNPGNGECVIYKVTDSLEITANGVEEE